MRILFVGPWFDYGDPRRGLSFENVNFFDTLSRMKDIQVEFFPFDVELRKLGRDKMNGLLLRRVNEIKEPDLCFFVLFTDEIETSTIAQITE